MLYRRLPRFHPKGFNMGELHNSTLHSTPFRLCTKKACGELVRGEAGNEGTNLTLEGLSEKAWLGGKVGKWRVHALRIGRTVCSTFSARFLHVARYYDPTHFATHDSHKDSRCANSIYIYAV
jgi:hypothetical protein